MLIAADIAPGSGRNEAPAPETAADGPVRRCVVSGKTGPRDSFLRFVVAPDGTLTPDIEGKLPGRGLWRDAPDRSGRPRGPVQRSRLADTLALGRG